MQRILLGVTTIGAGRAVAPPLFDESKLEINDRMANYSVQRQYSPSERKGELRKPENEQILGCSFTRFPGDLKLPMDTYLHASRREVNQTPVTKPGLKQRLVVMFWVSKITSEVIS